MRARGFGPAFLFLSSAIRLKRMCQKNAGAQQTKNCCCDVNHGTHPDGPTLNIGTT
jgi:hypothetical protein